MATLPICWAAARGEEPILQVGFVEPCATLCEGLRYYATLRRGFSRQVSNTRAAPKGLQRRDTCGASETLIRDLSAANGIAAGRYMPLGHSAWRW